MRLSYTSAAGLASIALLAASCGATPLALAPLAVGAPLALRGRPVEGSAASFAVVMACVFAGLHSIPALVAVGAALMIPAAIEAPLRVSWRPLTASISLAVLTALYSYALYLGIPRASDLPAYTVEALSEPGARVGFSLTAGVYGALLSYALARPSRTLPRLLGWRGLAGLLRRHRAAPLWIPLAYLVAAQRLVVALPTGLGVVAASLLAYARTDNLDVSLAAAYAAAALLLWALGGSTPL